MAEARPVGTLTETAGLREAIRSEIAHANANGHILASDSQGVAPGERVPAVRVDHLLAVLAAPRSVETRCGAEDDMLPCRAGPDAAVHVATNHPRYHEYQPTTASEFAKFSPEARTGFASRLRPPLDPLREAAKALSDEFSRLDEDESSALSDAIYERMDALRAAHASPAAPRPEGHEPCFDEDNTDMDAGYAALACSCGKWKPGEQTFAAHLPAAPRPEGLRDEAGRSAEWYAGYNAAMRDYDKRVAAPRSVETAGLEVVERLDRPGNRADGTRHRHRAALSDTTETP